MDVVNKLVSEGSLTCADLSEKDKMLTIKLAGDLELPISFYSLDWLKYFDEAKPLWPLVLREVYFQIIKKQDTHQLLNDEEKAFDCGGEEMTTLCQFGYFMGRIYGEPMVAINVYNNKDVDPRNLWNLVEPILNTVLIDPALNTVQLSRPVTVWNSNKPNYWHKYITQVNGVRYSTKESKVTYFNSAGVESHTSLNDVIGSKPYTAENPGDSTFFLLPLSQFLHGAPPRSPPSPSAGTLTVTGTTSVVGETMSPSAIASAR
jgi:hypothetical protein